MAISVNWTTQVVTIPQADLNFVSADCYELDLDWLHSQLRAEEATSIGMTFPITHDYQEVFLPGTILTNSVNIINGYTIEFSPDTDYTVKVVNGNSNVGDVASVTQVNLDIQSALSVTGCTPEEFWDNPRHEFLDQTTYTNGVLVSGRIRHFATSAQCLAATDGGTGEGEVATFQVSATATGSLGEATTYRKVRTS